MNQIYRLLPTKSELLKSILVALFFSSFIYFEHFEITSYLVNSIFGLFAIYGLLNLSKKSVITAGFFIGLLWFYWIGFSFEYYHVSYMIPIVSIGFGFIYALFFGTLALSDKIYLKALTLFGLTFFEPFDFNWMQSEILFINSYFGVEKWQFGAILIAVALFSMIKTEKRYFVIILLISAINFSDTEKEMPKLDITLVSMQLPQELKWLSQTTEPLINYNFKAIYKAIKNKKDVVVLSESAFAMFLNLHPQIIERLKELSYDITIVTGALLHEEAKSYNVTYIFNKGEIQIAKKMILVPFGEYIPLPKFMREFINQTFFDGASDYVSADSPTDFTIKGVKFRNAVCYEATCKEIYEDYPSYVIAISNNAWFTPSIEPTLQKLLMKFYAKKYNTIIFHAANMGGTGIIK